MQVRLVVIPGEDGLNVVVWDKWAVGSMRVRHFEARTAMVAALEKLGLIAAKDMAELEAATFTDSCLHFSAEIDEEVLAAHGFPPLRPVSSRPSIYQTVTNRIISSLKAGVIPWEKPWKSPRFAGGPFPRNFSTGKPYR